LTTQTSKYAKLTMPERPKALVVTRLGGPVDSDAAEHQNPTWSDIEAAIRRLDGHTCSLVILRIGPPPVPHMAIGGGEAGKYIVYTARDNLSFHTLINPQASSGKCFLVAGGQRGDYDLKVCVSLSEALRAARIYAETGGHDPTLTWHEQT
jgi:Immunity protein Imm1